MHLMRITPQIKSFRACSLLDITSSYAINTYILHEELDFWLIKTITFLPAARQD